MGVSGTIHLGLLHSVSTSEITGYKQHNQESQSEILGVTGHKKGGTVPALKPACPTNINF